MLSWFVIANFLESETTISAKKQKPHIAPINQFFLLQGSSANNNWLAVHFFLTYYNYV